MSVSGMFNGLSNNLMLSRMLKDSISARVGKMIRCLNEDFRTTSSDTANSFYVGSYGRNTAIPSISDIDVVFVLPVSTYWQYDRHLGNGQSALLQAIRNSVRRTYPTTQIAADGQVISVNFVDGVKVEILGAVLNENGGYTFPDSNGGGRWRECKPKHEINEFSTRNGLCNSNLVQLGRMARAWKDNNNVPISGMLIDTLAYQFIGSWGYRDKSYLYHDLMTRDFFAFLAGLDMTKTYWLAPGSNSHVYKTGVFQHKAKTAYDYALSAIQHLDRDELWSAHYDFRRIYGNAFPAYTTI